MKTLKEKLEENKKVRADVLKILEQNKDPNATQDDPERIAKSAVPSSPGTANEPASGSPESTTQEVPAIDPNSPPVDQVVTAVNIIRSGKSFKEPPVKVELEKYLDDLNDQEKAALINFLTGLSQVATGQIPGDKVVEPSKKLKIVSADAGKKVPVKTAGQLKQVPTKEDTTAPAPIAAKKR